jgi:protein gp37
MAENSAIAWTDSTFNPWFGCSSVSAGCRYCYAEALDIRMGGDHWGPGKTPRTMSPSNWAKPLKWQREASASGIRRKVFTGSMCDWAAVEAPQSERDRLWELIRKTPMLDWQLLTKRAERIVECLPSDWGQGYPNVWLGVSVENISSGVPRIPILRDIPACVRFLSCEPLLEDLGALDLRGIDWVIVGGESGPHARPMQGDWVESIQKQCDEQEVAFFFKQWGSTAKDKGGDLLHGKEVKAWPAVRNASGVTLPT